jgi:GT2 family glycosyltransferase
MTMHASFRTSAPTQRQRFRNGPLDDRGSARTHGSSRLLRGEEWLLPSGHRRPKAPSSWLGARDLNVPKAWRGRAPLYRLAQHIGELRVQVFSSEIARTTNFVSIVIKAYNEAANIERCLLSCLDALDEVDGEIIVADSLSDDDTVAIAARYPVRIVQLLRAADRGCGVAAQLGFQHARGKYIHLIDGDMELPPGFLPEAIDLLETRPDLAGVGGQLEELRPESHLSRIRASRPKAHHQMPGEVDRLNGGGLYRRQAIEQAGGYLGHPGLHAHEELELALRLRAAGWKLARTSSVSMRHAAHVDPPFKLLARRWRSGYAFGAGELLRSALGRPYLPEVLREFWFHAAMWGILVAAPGRTDSGTCPAMAGSGRNRGCAVANRRDDPAQTQRGARHLCRRFLASLRRRNGARAPGQPAPESAQPHSQQGSQ